MCSSKSKVLGGGGGNNVDKDDVVRSVVGNNINNGDDHMNGRPVLQPNCSNITITSRTTTTTTNTTSTTLLYRRCHSMKKPSTTTTTNKPLLPPLQQPLSPPKITSSPTCAGSRIPNNKAATPPVSPKLKSPRPPAVKRSSINNNDPTTTPKTTTTKTSSLVVKKSKVVDNNNNNSNSLKYSSSLIVESPGSIAAARREAVANMQVQRKMKIAHYGRTKSANFERRPLNNNDLLLITPPILQDTTTITARSEDKRCNFITANSDPIYIAYHDEEWGVPVHDDRMLFELLLLTGAQVGSDWTSVLKRRQDFRDAFSGFDAESVSKYTEKKITSISADYGIEVSLVRGVVDNSKRILEIKRQFGSFDKYLWAFVNHKPIATQYKSCFKIPVKTSKSETISKDMVKKGFRLVGPTVIHSFMQAAGLTNDHLLACPRHLQCVALASQSPTVAPAL